MPVDGYLADRSGYTNLDSTAGGAVFWAYLSYWASKFEDEHNVPVRIFGVNECEEASHGNQITVEGLSSTVWTLNNVAEIRRGHDDEWNDASWGGATNDNDRHEWAKTHGFTIWMGVLPFVQSDHGVVDYRRRLSPEWFVDRHLLGMPVPEEICTSQNYGPVNYDFGLGDPFVISAGDEDNEDSYADGLTQPPGQGYVPGVVIPGGVTWSSKDFFISDRLFVNFDYMRFFTETYERSLDYDIDELRSRVEEQRQEQIKRTVIRLGKEQSSKALRSVRTSMESTQREIHKHEQLLHNQREELISLGAQYRVLMNNAPMTPDKAEERARTGLQAITDHPLTNKLDVIGNELVITTEEIMMTDPRGDRSTYPEDRRSVPLGPYTIKINIEGRGVHIHNTINPRKGRPHPHVDRYGIMCTGGASDTISDLIGQLDFASVYDIIIVLLQGFNPKDAWGSYADYWMNPDYDVLDYDDYEE